MFLLGQDNLNSTTLVSLAKSSTKNAWGVDENTWKRLQTTRKVVDKCVTENKVVYGINTGFGFLSNVSIEASKLRSLQINLIKSHAAGVGALLPVEQARALLILKLHNLLLGGSGVSQACIQSLLQLLEKNLIPAIPCQGSVGASGDLAPLAHMALVMLGEGQVFLNKELLDTEIAFKQLAIKPYEPQAKEGLALINGTQFIASLAAFALEQAKNIMRSADAIAALSLDAFRGSLSPFDERLHNLRPHRGQKEVAKNFRNIFGSHDEILKSHENCNRVQDPYSFRCIPQVHGASRQGIYHIESVINQELNSSTDNPAVFDDGDIISGGNFHGQPLALVLDYLAICVAEFGSISERRIEKLTNPHFSDLPAFLSKESGVNSGFMIPHVVAAALVSENKILCHPASVDSIPTSADKEDHVSMGPISARKAIKINEHLSKILAIELLTACQGLDLLKPLQPCKPLLALHKATRSFSPELTQDRSLSRDIEKVAGWILNGGIIDLFSEQKIELI
ncbi:MAG: histidine ammonia-lyase [Oligoflexales bacterium]|nr:histidine ammonia-lyase [Oligoflexales bacterium]